MYFVGLQCLCKENIVENVLGCYMLTWNIRRNIFFYNPAFFNINFDFAVNGVTTKITKLTLTTFYREKLQKYSRNKCKDRWRLHSWRKLNSKRQGNL